jgi:hypothetical protein
MRETGFLLNFLDKKTTNTEYGKDITLKNTIVFLPLPVKAPN